MVQLGVPAVIIPGGSPERQQNAAALRDAGLARVVGSRTLASWELHDHPQSSPDWGAVRLELDTLLEDRATRDRARQWSLNLSAFTTEAAWQQITDAASIPVPPA